MQFGGQTPLNLASRSKAAGVQIIGTPPESIEWPKTANFSPRARSARACTRRPAAPPATDEAWRSRSALVIRSGSALVRSRRARDGDCLSAEDCAATCEARSRSARSVRCWSIVFSKTRSKSMSIASPMARSRSSARSWNTSRKPAFTAATAPASSRPFPCRARSRTRSPARPKRWRESSNVRGLMNVQFAVKDEDVYVLEVNPRASRTAPFVSKAIGVPLAKLAAKVMAGKTLRNSDSRAKSCRRITPSRKPSSPFSVSKASTSR